MLPLTGCGRSQPRGWSGPAVADGGVYVGSLDGRVVRLLMDVDSPEDRVAWKNDPEARQAWAGDPALPGWTLAAWR
ncbi:PQQ-binding-like beta-propeller repeat protein [Chloroflexota bacterium]